MAKQTIEEKGVISVFKYNIEPHLLRLNDKIDSLEAEFKKLKEAKASGPQYILQNSTDVSRVISGIFQANKVNAIATLSEEDRERLNVLAEYAEKAKYSRPFIGITKDGSGYRYVNILSFLAVVVMAVFTLCGRYSQENRNKQLAYDYYTIAVDKQLEHPGEYYEAAWKAIEAGEKDKLTAKIRIERDEANEMMAYADSLKPLVNFDFRVLSVSRNSGISFVRFLNKKDNSKNLALFYKGERKVQSTSDPNILILENNEILEQLSSQKWKLIRK